LFRSFVVTAMLCKDTSRRSSGVASSETTLRAVCAKQQTRNRT
jgi:hypothetical protein